MYIIDINTSSYNTCSSGLFLDKISPTAWNKYEQGILDLRMNQMIINYKD